MSPKERKKMVSERVDISLSRQCKILRVSRSSLYYTPMGFSAETLELMRQIDRVFTKYPFFGSRQIAAYLPRVGYHAGRHRVRRLMKVMGLEAIYKRPNTRCPATHACMCERGQKAPREPDYPYLLRNMQITRPNQVLLSWLASKPLPGSGCADISYIPVKRGFLYLVAIMDWATRKVLSWRLSNTMDAGFCKEALDEAIDKYGPPEIMNTDQGSQFTGSAWITTLTEAGVKISMDGRGRYLDNIFIKRLCRSLKQEAVYLHELTDGFVAEQVIGEWITFYNTDRPHTALDKRTPHEAYFDGKEMMKAA